MKQRAIIDVICKSGMENLAGEIGVLLGQTLVCSDVQLKLTTKEDLFSNLERKKTVLTRMTVSGNQEGHCYLLTRTSSAAILGGTLIMLPEDIIEENAKSEKLDGELNDAFGEVANIIAGVFTQAFVDKYAKNLRFIKKTVEELIPTKIDPASDEPFAPGNYHITSGNMKIGDKDLGPFEFVVPAAIFELEEAVIAAPTKVAAPVSAEVTADPEPIVAASQPAPPQGATPAAEKKPAFADTKKLIDVVFKAIIGQAGEEISTLLGQSLQCNDIQLVMTNKADFFSNHCNEKSILTHMKITGDREGLGFMVAQVHDAVVLGGTLIMLPEDQIVEQKNKKQFDGDVKDAYGEVANILSGSLNQIILERYPKKLHFIKTEAEIIIPTKVDPASDHPFAEGNYYLASFAIQMEGYELHRLLLIFPAEIFDLENEQAAEPTRDQAAPPVTAAATQTTGPAPGGWEEPQAIDPAAQPTAGSPKDASIGKEATPSTATEFHPGSEPAGPPLVLLISDKKADADPFVEILSSAEHQCQVLTFHEEIKDLFQQHKILGIFLIMAQVGEKGFASAIKLQSAGKPLPPLIFAGPEWTRSAVLRAVKYGAKDILLTPASSDDIRDKVNRYIKKAS